MLASFALNIFNVKIDPTATFYAPQTRFWELLCGSLLAYKTLHDKKATPPTTVFCNIQSTLGTSLIILGMLLVTKESFFLDGGQFVQLSVQH